MKQLFNSAVLLAAILFTGCQKESAKQPGNEEIRVAEDNAAYGTAEVLNWYSSLDRQTMWELRQARAATAKYRFDTTKAYQDGYRNIDVDVENMGHHFLKLANVDGTFDMRRPEILVYNGREDGTMELVAVEYAVPFNLPEPAGFTGNHDEWNYNTTFELWLLHAWVWKYNPDGVFNPTNPDVHLH